MPKHNKERRKMEVYKHKPKRPCLYGTISLRKQEKPIRPIVNWKNCPAYKVAKHVNEILRETLQLPNMFIVRNSTTLIQALMENK
jgi:hypothetical protein